MNGAGLGWGGGGGRLLSGVRGVFRGRIEDQRKGSRSGRERRSAHLTHLRREAVVSSPRWAAGAPSIWLRRRGWMGSGVSEGLAARPVELSS